MPCYEPPVMGDRDRKDDIIEELRGRIDIRTAHLCTVLGLLESKHSDVYKTLPSVIISWHELHKQFDEERNK